MERSTIVIFLFVCWNSLWWSTNAHSNCSVVLINGTTSSHYYASGLYQQQAETCNNRPVFKQINGDMYLYYIADFETWQAGQTSCVNLGVVFGSNDVGHPADETDEWLEFVVDSDGIVTALINNPNLTVTCSSLIYTGCQYVRLSGTDYSDEWEGTYTVLSSSDICYGKFSYSRSSTEYLYYYFGHWVVSNKLCHDLVHMQVQDGALYPYDVTGTWLEQLIENRTHNSPSSKVRCPNGGGREVLGGSVLAVALLYWIIMN